MTKEAGLTDTSALLARLSSKPGVQSTLILSAENGSVIRVSGLLSQTTSNPDGLNPSFPQSGGKPEYETAAASTTTTTTTTDARSPQDEGEGNKKKEKTAEDVAKMVWGFMASAGEFVQELDEEEEVKLLRLRTKRNEIVIVPDSRFLLVVIHDTPSHGANT
ncbi:MAG: hypothetical protein M1834_009248 [Cirrosporium novae-zelandiae]|nr:MAG: hypothetical protein M1834_009248 [Cirrosporium novae-zelandiae]